MNSVPACRTYILFRNALFAQGVRSVLERESDVRIVGMANDFAEAIKAVQALRPDVILVEEPIHSKMNLSFLEAADASRIVAISLQHVFATVYDHHRMAVAEPSDLVKAIHQSPRARDDPQVVLSDPPEAASSGVRRRRRC